MSFLPKMFLDNGAEGGNSGGGAAPIVEGNEGGGQQQQAELPKSVITDEELKGYGFDSQDALKEFLQKQKEEKETPEEKLQKENIAKANLLKFSTENKLLTVDDYNAFENVKSKADRDLVFENFIQEYKEDHPEITDQEELEEAAKEDFEYEYKLKDGLSDAAKKRGEAKLAKAAQELRSPFESKVTTAKSRYDETTSQEKLIKDNYPKFEKFLKESIVKNTPDKFVAYKHKEGDEEIEIDVPLTQKERDAMFKEFATPKTFQSFLDKKPEEIQAIMDKKMQGWVKLNKADEINSKTFEIAKGIGVKSGSTVGAEHPFPLRQQANVISIVAGETLEENNRKMQAQRERIRVTH